MGAGYPQWERVPSPGAEVRQFLLIEIDSMLWLQAGSKLHMIEVLHLRTR